MIHVTISTKIAKLFTRWGMRNVLVLVLLLLTGIASEAQVNHRMKVAVFTPAYLDSAFDDTGKFRFEKTGARFSAQGLDFYLGVQLALDSLKKRGAGLDVYVYDLRGNESLQSLLARKEISDANLIIAQSNADETRTLATTALQKKIPFISVSLPNDANITNNPFYVILNTTLQSHVEGIYRFLQKYHSLDKIMVFTKPGAQEDRLKEYMESFAKATAGTKLNIQYVDAGSAFTAGNLAPHLDSTRKTVCVAGSLDESFGLRLIQTLNSLNKTYPVRLIGMPTWEGINLAKAGDLEIIYTNPFFYNRNTPLETQLSKAYSNTLMTRGSDFFYRGYESMLRFGLLLLDTHGDMASNLSRKGNVVLTEFDIQPVFKDRNAMTLDYFENKHLYFIKVLGGARNLIQ